MAQPSVQISAACADQAPAIAQLLQHCDLPHADIAAHLRHFYVAMAQRQIIAAVGLEMYAPVALLRSLVVAAAFRGAGLGRRLCERAEAHARGHGIVSLYLLTASAPAYFDQLRYRRIHRETAPDAIKRTQEYAVLCPVTAICMYKALGS